MQFVIDAAGNISTVPIVLFFADLCVTTFLRIAFGRSIHFLAPRFKRDFKYKGE